MMEANVENDPILKIIRGAIRDNNPKVREIMTKLGQHRTTKTPREAYTVYQQTGLTDPRNPARHGKTA